jgi:RNA polymerase sigma factor (sigma-70 family)
MDKSKEALVVDNLNLVYAVIRTNFPRCIHDEDIVQIGRLGLCEAAETWDESKSQFTTYAWSCITNKIRKEFRQRKKHKNTCSLNNPVAYDADSKVMTYEDILTGDEDVNYCDEELYYSVLNDKERELADLLRKGKTPVEIAEDRGCSTETIYQIRRSIILKWKKLNE